MIFGSVNFKKSKFFLRQKVWMSTSEEPPYPLCPSSLDNPLTADVFYGWSLIYCTFVQARIDTIQ